jgi:hypothetical protein
VKRYKLFNDNAIDFDGGAIGEKDECVGGFLDPEAPDLHIVITLQVFVFNLEAELVPFAPLSQHSREQLLLDGLIGDDVPQVASQALVGRTILVLFHATQVNEIPTVATPKRA